MGKIGEHLFFKLWPIASGNHGHFDDAEKVMQQCRHFGIQETIYFRQVCRPDHKQLAFSLGYVPSGSEISNKLTALRGRQTHAPTTAGKSSTSPLPTA